MAFFTYIILFLSLKYTKNSYFTDEETEARRLIVCVNHTDSKQAIKPGLTDYRDSLTTGLPKVKECPPGPISG